MIFNLKVKMKISDVAKAIGVVLPDSIDNNIECNRVLTQSIYVKPNDVIEIIKTKNYRA